MNIYNQPQKEYNVFNTDGEDDEKETLFLQFNPHNDTELDQVASDRLDAEWMFFTEILGWQEGLSEIENSNSKQDME